MKKQMSVEKRFWEKVKKTPGCWEWTGWLHEHGYGVLDLNKGSNRFILRANRYSWELHFGKIPKNLLVCHKCDNRKCVRPDHLFLGTHKDNAQDMIKKSRDFPPPIIRGEKNHKSKLTAKQVLDIRRMDLPSRVLGRIYMVSHTSIRNIKSRKTWTHI